MKKINFLRIAFLAMLLFVTNISFGQILEWNFTTSTTGQEATVNATTNNANLETSILTRGLGAPAASTDIAKTFSSTMTTSPDKATAITNNAYFQFTVQAKAGYFVSLTDLDVSLIISSATLSAMIYQFQYSLDGTNFIDIGFPTTLTDTNVKGVFQPTVDLAQYANLKNVPSATTITFRLYAWGGTTGDFGIGYSYSASVPTLIVGGIVSNTTIAVSNDPKIAGWEFSAYGTSNPTPVSVDAKSFNGNLITPVLSKGTGLNNATHANYYYVAATSVKRANKAAAISGNDYFQFSIPPGVRNKVSLSTIKYRFKTSIATLNYIWAYSTDGGNTFTEIGSEAVFTSSTGGLEYQLDLSGIANLQNVASTVLLRLYVWSSASLTSACGFGRILNGSNAGSSINCIYIRGKVDLDPMAITVETTDNFQKKILNNNVLYFTNRVYTANNIPSILANFEFLASAGGASSDGITPTGTIIPSTNGDIYVLARTSTGVSGWTLVSGTEFYYLVAGLPTGISVFKKTVTAGQRVPIPVVDNFQEAKPFAKTINYNVYRSVGSGNWSDNTKWEVSTDNVNWTTAISAPTAAVSSISIPAGQELVIDVPATASIITVNPAAKLTVNAATAFSATTLNLNSDATGTATFIDDGTSSITTANVQQYLNTARNWYISSPVALATVPSNIAFYSYDESGSNTGYTTPATANWVSAPQGSSLIVGKGYIAQPVGATTFTFSGALNNNSSYSIPVTKSVVPSKSGFNLVGNPYPAYIDWSLVIADAENANIGTTMWYRTKNTGDIYTFATHNGTSGVTVTGTANTTITRFIPPMQSFWVLVNNGVSSTSLKIKKTMLDHRDVIGNTMKAPKSANNPLLRLQVSNGTNTDEAVVYFNANASNGFDAYDSPKMSNANQAIPEIYTLAANEELVINGMNELVLNTELPVGFRTGEFNNFSIKASEFNNFDSNIRIILKDKIDNTEKDLTDEAVYNFTSDVANNENRFSIILRTAGMTTDISDFDNQAISIFGNANKKITIRCSSELIGSGTVSVYDEIGQKLEHKSITGSTTVLNTTYSSGVYLVCVKANGKTKTQRVIIN